VEKFRQSVFEVLERKIVKGSRGHLAQIQWVGRWKIQAACFEVLERKKNVKIFRGHLTKNSKGEKVENQAERLEHSGGKETWSRPTADT
jgi:hypothetical protein